MHAQAVADYILVTVPHLRGRMVVNQFTAVFIMLLPYIQLESLRTQWELHPSSELLFAQWELHSSYMSS